MSEQKPICECCGCPECVCTLLGACRACLLESLPVTARGPRGWDTRLDQYLDEIRAILLEGKKPTK